MHDAGAAGHDCGLTELRTREASFARVPLPAGEAVEGHSHDSPHLCLVLRGRLFERDNGDRCVGAGEVRHSPGADPHRFVAGDEGADCFVIVGERGRIDAPERRVYDEDGRLATTAAAIHANVSNRSDQLELWRSTLELFAQGRRLARSGGLSGPPDWLVEARRLIGQSHAGRLEGDDLASLIGVHRVHLARSHREHFGCTVGEAIRSAQVSAAREMVVTTSRPLAEVALATGHADQSHMTRRFRESFGTTPGRMRRLSAEERGNLRQVTPVQDRCRVRL